jgi:pimeloyl-ACP methyl ester carboxylesterase
MVELAGAEFNKNKPVDIPEVALALGEEARRLGRQLFGEDTTRITRFAEHLMAIYQEARDKDFLLIHNPGGWGNSPLESCLHWERSVVAGISATLEKLGYRLSFSQHFRGGAGWREHLRDIRDYIRFFTFKRRVLAAEVEFLTRHIQNLRVIMIGISQGAGFSNAVMQRLNQLKDVYSIELGVFFYHRARRVITERTLAIDHNGLVPDALIEGDLVALLMTLPAACFRWVKSRLKGRPVKFSRCIKLAGHDYLWEYPKVSQQIGDFLKAHFGARV